MTVDLWFYREIPEEKSLQTKSTEQMFTRPKNIKVRANTDKGSQRQSPTQKKAYINKSPQRKKAKRIKAHKKFC